MLAWALSRPCLWRPDAGCSNVQQAQESSNVQQAREGCCLAHTVWLRAGLRLQELGCRVLGLDLGYSLSIEPRV